MKSKPPFGRLTNYLPANQNTRPIQISLQKNYYYPLDTEPLVTFEKMEDTKMSHGNPPSPSHQGTP